MPSAPARSDDLRVSLSDITIDCEEYRDTDNRPLLLAGSCRLTYTSVLCLEQCQYECTLQDVLWQVESLQEELDGMKAPQPVSAAHTGAEAVNNDVGEPSQPTEERG
jgi:hypothetical protein